MRDILFRGKRIDNGDWVEGSLVVWPDGQTDICFSENGDFFEMAKTIVLAETVSQYTGLSDKNGKKIFEGDIVVICYETDGEEFSETKRVHYNEKECCWYPMRWEECCEHCDHYTEVKSIEVIGNIHDNPELLGGGEDG